MKRELMAHLANVRCYTVKVHLREYGFIIYLSD